MADTLTGTPAGASGTGSGAGSPSQSGGSPPSSPSPVTPSSGSTSTATGTPGSSGTPSGDPAFDHPRFKEINDKYTALRWAESHDPDEVQQSVNLKRWFDQDPKGAYEYVTGLMRRGGYIEEPAAPRPPSSGDRFTDSKTGRPLPDIVIQETGQRFYSADQADRLVEWQAEQLDKRIKSLEGRTTMTDAQQEARSILNEAQRSWPGFVDFAEDIYKEMQRDRRITLETAYRRIAVPKLRQIERQAIMEETRDKVAAGSGGINPGSASPQHTTELTKLPISELFRREMQRRGWGK